MSGKTLVAFASKGGATKQASEIIAEYGLLSTKGVEIGYYDRLSDKYCSYLRQNFPKDDTKKLPSNS